MTPAVEWEYSLYLAMFPLYFSQLIESLRFHKWSVAIQKPGATATQGMYFIIYLRFTGYVFS